MRTLGCSLAAPQPGGRGEQEAGSARARKLALGAALGAGPKGRVSPRESAEVRNPVGRIRAAGWLAHQRRRLRHCHSGNGGEPHGLKGKSTVSWKGRAEFMTPRARCHGNGLEPEL